MSTDFLYEESATRIIIMLLALMILAGELGFRIGRHQRPAPPDPVRTQVNGIQAALLGLFALLLGFTFAMALSRFDLRKDLVVQEANAASAVALHAHFLPRPEQEEVDSMLRRYITLRLDVARLPNILTPAVRTLNAKTWALQDRLWVMAVAHAELAPQSVPAELFAMSVSQLIDVKNKRNAALTNRVPDTVLILLFGFAILTMGVVGYSNGLCGDRVPGAMIVLALLVTLVVLVIVDLDRPHRGLIRVSQESMIELEHTLEMRRE